MYRQIERSPSIKTMEEKLNLTREQAKEIKNLLLSDWEEEAPMNCHWSHTINYILDRISTIGEFYGIDTCYCSEQYMTINSGDCYNPTFIYNRKKRSLYIGDFATIAERI